eukprot:TRINITY_DN41708_c1_g1_i1.p1 TRINITY_DN41708_c1_g1~~TRINITY_DN41708_c1_g1_i1.p1  ORF type:complete len:337 (+),score=48.56 TRINITY_DN41708_c1_g1_i1:101-1111(+)
MTYTKRLRILLTNDDGPPAEKSRYILPFYRALRERGHSVHVCIPSEHRSWASKAMNPWQKVSVKTLDLAEDRNDWWLCEEAMPAVAANIGLHHGPGPFDLLISGPNFGRNTASAFVLSSGTLAGALEAALGGWKAVAVSFDNEKKEMMMGDAGAASASALASASARTIDLIERLVADWPANVELFNVNVPVASCDACLRPPQEVLTCIESRARYHSAFQVSSKGAEEFHFGLGDTRLYHEKPLQAPPGVRRLPTDAAVLNSGKISVTPLLANFSVAPCRPHCLRAGAAASGFLQARCRRAFWKATDFFDVPSGWFLVGCFAGGIVATCILQRQRRS